MKRILFFDNAQALDVSMRFFVNVPLFLMLAAAALLVMGPPALQSRWTPAALALSHLMTLGVISSAMLGALLQILPVASAVVITHTRLTASVVHSTLTAGTLALAASLYWQSPTAAQLAFVLLGVAFFWFLIAVAYSVYTQAARRSHASEPLLAGVQLALLGLLVTVLLGLGLLAAYAWGVRWHVVNLTNIHAAWGLIAWVLALISAVSFKVIPVFQVTELFPGLLMWALHRVSFVLLLGWSLTSAFVSKWTGISNTLLAGALGLLWLVYAGVGWDLIAKRKRPRPDASARFWQLALASVGAAFPVWLALHMTNDARLQIVLGVLIILGVALSAISGMLYKIMPILMWQQSQKLAMVRGQRAPRVGDMLSPTVGKAHFYCHTIGVCALLGAGWWPTALTPVGALFMLLSSLALAANMLTAGRNYRRARQLMHH